MIWALVKRVPTSSVDPAFESLRCTTFPPASSPTYTVGSAHALPEMEHRRQTDSGPGCDRERGVRSVRLPADRTIEVGPVNRAARSEGAEGGRMGVAESVARAARNGCITRGDGSDERGRRRRGASMMSDFQEVGRERGRVTGDERLFLGPFGVSHQQHAAALECHPNDQRVVVRIDERNRVGTGSEHLDAGSTERAWVPAQRARSNDGYTASSERREKGCVDRTCPLAFSLPG